MNGYILKMKWSYNYDKEGTWSYNESGEESYPLIANEEYSLPESIRKKFKITSLTEENGVVTAKIYLDYNTYTVTSGGESVPANATDSYCAAGDYVYSSWALTFTIAEK